MAMGIKTTMGIDYDFIKTEEAKQIFIKLEKKENALRRLRMWSKRSRL